MYVDTLESKTNHLKIYAKLRCYCLKIHYDKVRGKEKVMDMNKLHRIDEVFGVLIYDIEGVDPGVKVYIEIGSGLDYIYNNKNDSVKLYLNSYDDIVTQYAFGIKNDLTNTLSQNEINDAKQYYEDQKEMYRCYLQHWNNR